MPMRANAVFENLIRIWPDDVHRRKSRRDEPARSAPTAYASPRQSTTLERMSILLRAMLFCVPLLVTQLALAQNRQSDARRLMELTRIGAEAIFAAIDQVMGASERRK